MNKLQPSQSRAGPPSQASRDLRLKIDSIHSRIGWYGSEPRLVGVEVGPNTRRELLDRANEIDASLRHRDPSMLRAALLQLFALTKPNRIDAEHPEDLVVIYGAHLGRLPTWTVVEACRQVATGRGDSLTFAPAAPELYVRAEGIIDRILTERNKIDTILAAAPAPPEIGYDLTSEKERRTEKVKEVLKNFGTS